MKLNLITVQDSEDRSNFWQFFFRRKMELRECTLAEVRDKASDPNGLIRQYGLKEVITFYEESLLPCLKRLPQNVESRGARCEVACQLLQMRMHCNPPYKVIELAQEVLSDLARAHFADNAKADAETRKQVRAFIVPILAQIASRMQANTDTTEAIKAYELLDQLNSLDRRQRSEYAALLWKAGDERLSSLNVYIRHLSDCNWDVSADAQLKQMAAFIERRLAIDERSDESEIIERLLLNQTVLCGSNAPAFCLRNTGVGYLRLEKPERALPYLSRAHSVDNNSKGATAFHLGQAFFETQDFDKATETFEQAAGRGFNKSRIAAWQGLAYATRGKPDDATETFRLAERALTGTLDNEFFLYWGRASFLMGKVEDAQRRFSAALQKGDADWRAELGLAICLESQSRRSEAISALQEAPGLRESAPALYFLGRLLQSENKIAEAIACYRQAMALNPSDIEYCLAIGAALDHEADPQALPYLERAARARAGGPEVIRRLALAYIGATNHNRARHWIEVLARTCPASSSAKHYSARELASQATESFNSGNFGDAIEMWTRVAEVFVDDPLVNERLVLALVWQSKSELRSGKLEGLVEKLERADRLSPSDETRFLYGVSNFVRGDFYLAQQIFSAIARSQPDRPDLSSLKDLAALLSIGDETLSRPMREASDRKDSTSYLLDGIRSGLLRMVEGYLPPLSPLKLGDDLPWPPPPEPIELQLEPLEKTILRER